MDALLALVPRGRATGHAGAGDFALSGDGRLSRGGAWLGAGQELQAEGSVAVRAAQLPGREDDREQPDDRQGHGAIRPPTCAVS